MAEAQEDDQYVAEEEVVNIPGWSPTVSLEINESVQLGEEDEEELYCQRSKLYRFSDGEWKERGTGNAKLLKHKESGKIRFMMRQEKTDKIVGNHYVINYPPYCDLSPNSGSDKCWVWTAQNFSGEEEECQVEQLALKFGSAEKASEFKTAFDNAKTENAKVLDLSSKAAGGGAKPEAAKPKSEPTSAAKPDTQPSNGTASEPQVANPFAGMSIFGSATASTGGGLFSSAAESSASSGGLFSGGLFGAPAASSGASFSFANFSSPSSGGLFSSSSGGGLFGTAEAPKATQDGEEDEYVQEEELTVIPGWQASVTLDVKETVETGEEDEEELYSQLSKLYRFRDGEWKERGRGDAKLLKNKQNGKVRFLMRQEKTQKPVANHYVIGIPPYCDLAPNAGSDKCWVWTVPSDFAEEEPESTRFALKFGNPEIAAAFKDAFDEAKQINSQLTDFKDLGGSDGKIETPKEPAAPAAQSKSSPPVPAQPEVTGKESEPKASLFGPSTGGGLFGNFSATSPGIFGSTPSSSSSSPASTGGGLFSSVASGGLFSSASTGGLFSSVASGGLFSSAAGGSTGGGLFSSSAAEPFKAEAAEEEEDNVEEEVMTIPGWTPSVNLEVKETVESGEENEEVLYSQRSKLYRFRDGEWKERGLGEAKLLKDKVTGKVRFFLRQEKTGKIVGNHYVLDVPPLCDLKPNAGSDKFWVWMAQDCADGEPAMEQLALKFGSPELASQFKVAFDNAKQLNAQVGDFKAAATGAPTPKTTPKTTPKVSPKAAPASPPAPDAGKSLNGNSKPAEASPAPFASLSFSGSTSGGGLFSFSSGGLFGGSAATSGGGLFGGASTGASSGGLFGGGAAASSGGLFSGGIFGSAASSGGGLFGGSSSSAAPTSGLWGAPASTANGAGSDEKKEAEDDENFVVEEEVTQIPGWAPSVSLEVKDYVETGEEMEEEIYSQRAKLLRFRDGEWKERGLGDAKLLRHYETGKVRFLLRQEKTAKIVANHFVIDQPPYCVVSYNSGNKKILVWSALDWAEEEQQAEQFALRFKDEELADAFKEAFEAAKSGQTVGDDDDEDDENQPEEDEWVQAENSWDTGANGGGFAALAAQQAAAGGWRCPGCRLQWGEQVLECSVCEIPRPGYEEQAAAAKAGQDKGKQDAMSAFLGSSTSQAPASSAFGQSTPAAPISFGFGSGAATSSGSLFASASAQSSGSSIFGGGSAAPSSGGLFSGAAAASSGGLFSGAAAASSGGLFSGGTSNFAPPARAPSQPSSPAVRPSMAPSPKQGPSTPPAKPNTPPPPPAQGGFGSQCGGQWSGWQGSGASQYMAGAPPMQGMMGASPPIPGPPPVSPPPMDAAMIGLFTQAMAAQASAASGSNTALQSVEERMRRLETSFKDQEQMCSRAEERARKAESEIDSLRAEMKSFKLQRQEDSELIRRLQSKSDEQMQAIESLKRDLKQEREFRATTEASQRSLAETAQTGLKVANSALQIAEGAQKAVVQMREERSSSVSSAHVESLERSINDKLYALETKQSKLEEFEHRLPAASAPMSPGRASYFQNLHVQSSQRLSLANAPEKESRVSNGGLAMTEVKPLMRRIP